MDLANAISREDKWWQSMAKKHSLDMNEAMYNVSFGSQEIIGASKQPQAPKSAPQQEIRKRERPPEVSGLVSPAELEAMRKMQAEHGGE